MGRRRQFDVQRALDAVLGVFWRKGYEGASYADLTAAAGVERPALYAAFGNKEALFRRAQARYDEQHMQFFTQALDLPTAREVAAQILHSSADLHTRYPEHPGCLNVNGALAASDDAEAVRRALVDVRATGQEQLRQRFERARAQGDLPESADADALAAFVMAVGHGMAVQAKAGFSRAKLHAVAEQALRALPESASAPSPARS